MENRRGVCVLLTVALLGQALSVPVDVFRNKRGYSDNELDSKENAAQGDKDQMVAASSENRPTREQASGYISLDDSKEEKSSTPKAELATPVADDDDDDDDDDDFEPMNTAPTGGGGSNLFSLLRLANAFFPSSSGANVLIRNIIHGFLKNQFDNHSNVPYFTTGFDPTILLRRQDVSENLVNIDEIQGLKPPSFQRQETTEDEHDDNSESDESEESDENNAAEESVELDEGKGGNGNSELNGNDASIPKSDDDEGNGKESNENDSDFSEEPEGDGQGGGILGILAGLSGGEEGSDLGSLLAAVSGIVANLSGDGFDLNALIASGLGLFVGLLSEGEENPGAVIASYLLTSLDTITGGGSKNNGAFLGTFLSKLIRGTSAGGNPEASSEENGKEPEKDSAGFFGSFLMALLGQMSKGISGGSFGSSSHSNHPAEDRSLVLGRLLD